MSLSAASLGGSACLFAGWVAQRLRRVMQRRRSRPVLVALLERPVSLPPGHPEEWTAYPDVHDVALAQLHDVLWPGEEYLTALRSP